MPAPTPAETHTNAPAAGPSGDLSAARSTAQSAPRPTDRPAARPSTRSAREGAPTPIASALTPRDLLAAWPRSTPLACLWSGHAASAWSRWSIFAAVDRVHHPTTIDDLRDRLASRPARSASDPASAPPADTLPFTSGLIGWISYDAGRELEPAAKRAAGPHARDDRGWPLAALAECRASYAFDHARQRWFASGDLDALPSLTDLAETASRAQTAVRSHGSPPFEAGPLSPHANRASYTAAVARVIELIHAGDTYQVNLAHRLSTRFSGDARALLAALVRAAEPWFGGYLESTDPGPHPRRRALLSASPELFLSFDPATRRLTTRPMKGTAAGTAARHGEGTPAPDPLSSPKDRAELDMITDLLRNDLGRSAAFGSVRVDQPRTIETHATGSARVLQGVSTITATLRDGVPFADALLAAFPPGSVTGVPKIRAMQIIDELEPVRRGPYCGCFGFLDDTGRAAFNVCIRTAAISDAEERFTERAATNPAPGAAVRDPCVFENAHLDYAVGAGIIADSDPDAEWRETLDKAAVLARAIAPDRHADAEPLPGAEPAS